MGSVWPKIANRRPGPNAHAGPSSSTLDNLSYPPSPSQLERPEPNASGFALYPPGPPEITITPAAAARTLEIQGSNSLQPTLLDDGFEIARYKKFNSARIDAEIGADEVTRSIIVAKKHYPRLIGAGGGLLHIHPPRDSG